MGLIDPGRYQTDPSELEPPAVAIDIAPEKDTELLRHAFLQAINQLINSEQLSIDTADTLMDEVRTYYELEMWRASKDKYKRLLADTLITVARDHSHLNAIESNAFIDTKISYRKNRKRTTSEFHRNRKGIRSMLAKIFNT